MRDEWTINYSGDKLLAAASAKAGFHQGRHEWWKAKKAEIMETLRSPDGVQINESIVDELAKGGYASSANVGYGGPQVQIKPELLTRLKECVFKVREHEAKVLAYKGWMQMLGAHPNEVFKVAHDDWLYFFGNLPDDEQ